MEIVIDGTSIHCEQDLHDLLASNLDFGPHYGHNLAALRDRLSADVERPVHIIWDHANESRQNMGNDLFNKIIAIFTDVENQDKSYQWDDRFTFSLNS